MEKVCKVVRRSDYNDDYLEHKFKPKYLKKYKDYKGRWKYIYLENTKDNDVKEWKKTSNERNKYNKNEDSAHNRYGTYEHFNQRYKYTATDKLLSNESTATIRDKDGQKLELTIYQEGRLERGVETVKNVLGNVKKKTMKSLKSASNKGRSMIDKLLKKR